MDVLTNLLLGFSIAFEPLYLLYALVGAIFGTITGILPGLGPIGAMSMLLSFTLYIDAAGAMILFSGIYYGAMYGGSTTSIFLNIPGEAASVVTCIDGYRMAQKGRAGAALTVSAVGSFIAGNISIIGLTLAAPTLSGFALRFGPPEFLAIGVSGLLVLVRLSGGSFLQSIIMVLIGLALTTVGIDPISGVERFTFGIYQLSQGIDLVPVAMGLFGIAEVLWAAWEDEKNPVPVNVKMRELLPTGSEWRRSAGPIFRGSFLGFLIGLIPGPSHVISTFVSYFTDKKISKHPEEFGHGAIEGVAGPESANNAAVGGAYVPLLSLGLPFTPALAVVLGALLLHGVTPGPNLITEKPELFWTLIASMYIGNLMLLILNLPLVNLSIAILKVPKGLLLPLIAIICLIGVYSIGSSYVDLVILAVLGIAGYALRGTGYEPAPLVLALVLGPLIETSLRQSLKITRGDIGAIVFRPICIAIYGIVILAFLAPHLIKPFMRQKKGNGIEGRE